MAIELGPVRSSERGRGLWRRLGRGLLAGPRWFGRRSAEAAGAGEIANGARLIRALADRLRGPQDRNLPIARPDGTVDPQANAFLMGLSEEELLERWRVRRRQTAWLSWGCFGLAWLFLIVWGWQTVAASWGAGRLLSALQVLPFCAVLFLLAFRSAWQNWQLRTRRMGAIVDYLRTNETFWPH
ncbi:hypothetical protein GXW71_30135 [Roseomonas hellenica]|uniref:Uncharacterized protein n=1 Tax=Plastoroseomonas hellenica TaxID=2687306 RepID=A0ABS5F7W2_9PROT|nr:hypothetical protein [Plastoroseomonas hellenica]MBR0668650.1 hypothetical protein [Plastoroseomonas hellenica]